MILKNLAIVIAWALPQMAGATVYNVTPADNLSATINKLKAGDELYLADGQYDLTTTLKINCSGDADHLITIAAAEGAKPIIDFRGEANGTNGITVGGQYLYIAGLTIRYAGKKGIWLEKAKYCTLERLDVYGCCDSGIQLRSGGHNTVVNCDSHENFDYQNNGGNADGFADKQGDACPGNVYIGCRAWGNSDDGWDSFQRETDGTPTVYINCITYNNGPATFDISAHPRVLGVDAGLFADKSLSSIENGGNPNGFKLGGKGTVHNTELYRCLAIGHRSKGFDQNNNAGAMKIVNCTAYANNINYGFGNDYTYTLDIHNCISLDAKDSDIKTHKSGTVTQSHNTWLSGFSTSDADFESLDVDGLLLSPRNADGSLPETLLLHLKSGATNLIDKGMVYDKSKFEGDVIANYVDYKGSAPDLGCYETDGSASAIIGITDDVRPINPNLPCYDLNGRRVEAGYRGVVIQNGRKFLAK